MITEGRIEYALAKLSKDDFTLNTGGVAATTRYAGRFQPRLRYKYGRSKSQSAFAGWVEARNDAGRKGLWVKITPDDVTGAFPTLGARCYTFSKAADLKGHRPSCMGSTVLDQATINDTLRTINASTAATGPTAGGETAGSARTAKTVAVRAVKALSSRGAQPKSREAPDAGPVPVADREPARSQPSASRKRRRVDAGEEVKRVALAFIGAPRTAAQRRALQAGEAMRTPSGMPPPTTMFPSSTSILEAPLSDPNDPREVRAQIARHWAMIVEASTRIVTTADLIEDLVDRETGLTGREFGAPLDDGHAERVLLYAGGARSVADIPRLASALRNAARTTLAGVKAVADEPMDQDD